MTKHTDDERSTSNEQADNHDDTENITENCLINPNTCAADVTYSNLDSDASDRITFGYTGALYDKNDLKTAVGQIYKAMYRTRRKLGPQLSAPKVRPKLSRSLTMESTVTAEYEVAQLLDKAATRGIQDAEIGRPERSKAEITYRLMVPESHLDISDAEPV